ncbi:MAG: oxygenase MpaB family protein [Candidatus Nanopelagicales bacterium]
MTLGWPPLQRDYWQRHATTLDPEHDWFEIYAIAVGYEFPWDNARATEFALFRTFAVPEIGELLSRTGAFTDQTQKRYDDTAIIIDGAGLFIGGESEDRTPIQRLNQMHGSYDIPNDQMLYVLTSFVVPARRWIDRYGYRAMSPAEVDSSVRYWQRMGQLMGIRDIPADYAGCADYFDTYERERFAYSPGGRAVADATLDLFTGWYPAPLRPLIRTIAISLMDPHLRQALRYDAPPELLSRSVDAALALRKRIVGLLPSRRDLVRAVHGWRIKGYPGGWDMARIGTFPERSTPSA